MPDPVTGFINAELIKVPGDICICNAIAALKLKPFIYFGGIRRCNCNFRHELESDMIIPEIKLVDGAVIIRFLSAEIIARKTKDGKAVSSIKRIENPQVSQFISVSAKRSGIYNEHFFLGIVAEMKWIVQNRCLAKIMKCFIGLCLTDEAKKSKSNNSENFF